MSVPRKFQNPVTKPQISDAPTLPPGYPPFCQMGLHYSLVLLIRLNKLRLLGSGNTFQLIGLF